MTHDAEKEQQKKGDVHEDFRKHLVAAACPHCGEAVGISVTVSAKGELLQVGYGVDEQAEIEGSSLVDAINLLQDVTGDKPSNLHITVEELTVNCGTTYC